MEPLQRRQRSHRAGHLRDRFSPALLHRPAGRVHPEHQLPRDQPSHRGGRGTAEFRGGGRRGEGLVLELVFSLGNGNRLRGNYPHFRGCAIY